MAARFLFLLMLVLGMEVSLLSKESANLRKLAMIAGAAPFLIRLLSSVKVTSSVQCNAFSTDQCLSTYLAITLAVGGRLLIK